MGYTRSMQEKSPTTTIANYINAHPLTVVSTVDAQGYPHGSTVYAGSDDQLNIYFMTKTGTTKSHNIDNQSAVALTFSGEDHQTTLQLSGTAREVISQTEGTPAFQVLASIKHASRDFRLPIAKLDSGHYIVYKVTTDHALLTEYELSSQLDGRATIEFKR